MMNVNSSTTTLTFTAPSLPDAVFTGTVVVMVTAVNRYGVGPASDLVTAGKQLHTHTDIATWLHMHAGISLGGNRGTLPF